MNRLKVLMWIDSYIHTYSAYKLLETSVYILCVYCKFSNRLSLNWSSFIQTIIKVCLIWATWHYDIKTSLIRWHISTFLLTKVPVCFVKAESIDSSALESQLVVRKKARLKFYLLLLLNWGNLIFLNASMRRLRFSINF